ncbi:MAG: AbrB/MazE/SpoVT family DNA-binding domain-containing protein [Clostridium sp.]|uniref:AbrB/MazE/SpoVT family DNA-binding domain-containing protein n=1 Tax=Clostridium sp. TaxID=1506 RepID=UPI0025C6A2AC|nr:AbrB/MazE/SpoVT family DNA-binding domain-containing protein [Clostridium sp.]MBS4958832.1 AbrB/MazE/SpoVT family DNA-binding domain-containing protein [Clostridium sp.]
MKSIGVVRNLDQLGRVVLPKELRKSMDIKEGQPLEIYTEGEAIILKKYQPGCHCCGDTEVTTTILGIKLCDKCIDEFNKARKMIEELR